MYDIISVKLKRFSVVLSISLRILNWFIVNTNGGNIIRTCYSETRRDYLISNISNTRDSVSSGYPNTEKRVENTTRSGVFLTKFEVFG